MRNILLMVPMLIGIQGFSQSFPNGSYNFTGDPAAAYNKYLVVHQERTFTQVGVYKVLGTPYLMGQNHPGNFYSRPETGLNIHVSYNTYNQELSFTSSGNPDNPLIKEPGTLDSFLIKTDSLVTEEMFFVYAGLLGSDEKGYYRQMSSPSKNLVLYKKYKTVIGTTTNYIEADVRQFEVETSFYYYNREKNELKRLKPNYNAVKKELSFVTGLDGLLDRELFNSNHEAALKRLFNGMK